MSKQINIGGRLHSTEQGNVITGANEVLDDTKGKKQNVINADVDAELLRLDQSKQNNLTFDNTPTEDSNNPVKSSGVYAADKALSDAIEAILILIPSAATALNQLADKDFVNSSIATDTATFRGTSATGLTEAQFLEWANGLTHDMNDYVFWQTIDEAGNTLFKRYKWNGTQWLYEYTLNNSSFTADQWAAIMSGITSALVEKLNDLPMASQLVASFDAKQDVLTFDNMPTQGSSNPVKSGGVFSAIKDVTDLIPAEATNLNQLADKAYVLAQILAATPAFKGQFETLVELQAVQSPKAGDLGIVRTKDSDGYDVFTFYQYLNNQWNTFYTLSHHLLNKPATTGTTGVYPYNGMGRVVIPKMIVNGVNTLTHEAFEDSEGNDRENTIYVIQYDFTLGEDITVPANCVLEFDGGSLNGNYTLDGNGNTFNYNIGYNIFNCNIINFNIPYIDIRWFGAISDLNIENVIENNEVVSQIVTGTDCHDALSKAIEVSNSYNSENVLYNIGTAVPVKLIGNFYLASSVHIDQSLRLEGTYYGSKDEVVLPNLYVYGNISAFVIDEYVVKHENVIDIKNVSTYSTGNFVYPKYGENDGLYISTFLDYSCAGAPSRPGLISDSLFMGFFQILYFHSKYESAETVYCNLEIRNNVIVRNHYGIRSSIDKYVQDSIPWYDPTLTTNNHPFVVNVGMLNIHDNVIEHNCINGIMLYGAWASINICDNMMEGQRGPIDILASYSVINIERNYFESNNNALQPNYTDEDYVIRITAPYLKTVSLVPPCSTALIKNNCNEGYYNNSVSKIIVKGCFNNVVVEHNTKIDIDLSDLKIFVHKGFHIIPSSQYNVIKAIPRQWKIGNDSPVNAEKTMISGIPVYTIGSDNTQNTTIICDYSNTVHADSGEYVYLVYGIYLENKDNLPIRIYNDQGNAERLQEEYYLDRGEGWYTAISKIYINYAISSFIYMLNISKKDIFITDVYIYKGTTDLPALGLIQPKTIGTTAERNNLFVSDGFNYYDTDLHKPLWKSGSDWVDASGTPV